MSPQPLQWFRLYAEAIDDEKLRLLAFEDRWHYVALLCCKAMGLLDAGDADALLHRKLAVKMGLQLRELEAAVQRLAEVGLVDPQTFQPVKWDDRQFKSDTSTERVRAYRERTKRQRNVSETAQETETETEAKKQKQQQAPPAKPAPPASPVFITIPLNDGSEHPITEDQVREFSDLYPAVDVRQELRNMRGWSLSNTAKRKTRSGVMRFVNRWLAGAQDAGGNARAGPQTTRRPGKQVQALMALEAMKSGNRMAAGRNPDGAAEALPALAGPHSGG